MMNATRHIRLLWGASIGALFLTAAPGVPATAMGAPGLPALVPAEHFGSGLYVQASLARPATAARKALLSDRSDSPASRPAAPPGAMVGDQGGRRGRSPGLAFLLSAILPGTGQFYLGQNRGFTYLGADAACWFAQISYSRAASDEQNLSHQFAGRHWSLQRFLASKSDSCYWLPPDSALIVQLAPSQSSDYFAAIANTDIYRCGWDDFRTTYDPNDPNGPSPNRRTLEDMRSRQSDYEGSARLAVAALVLNRVVSAVDALRSARGLNQGRSQSFRLEGGVEGDWRQPKAVVRLIRILP